MGSEVILIALIYVIIHVVEGQPTEELQRNTAKFIIDVIVFWLICSALMTWWNAAYRCQIAASFWITSADMLHRAVLAVTQTAVHWNCFPPSSTTRPRSPKLFCKLKKRFILHCYMHVYQAYNCTRKRYLHICMGCGDVIIFYHIYVHCITTPCCWARKHCYYVRFYIISQLTVYASGLLL